MKEPPSGDRLELERKKQGIVLSRTKVLRDLEACRNPRYKDMLVSALADLELQLERFDLALGRLPEPEGGEAQ